VSLGADKVPYQFLVLTDLSISVIKLKDCKEDKMKPLCKNVVGKSKLDDYEKQKENVIKSDVWIEKDVCVKNNFFVLHDLKKDETIVTHSFLGLGFPNGQYKTFLENMRDQNLIDELAFSFYFNLEKSNNPILYLGS